MPYREGVENTFAGYKAGESTSEDEYAGDNNEVKGGHRNTALGAHAYEHGDRGVKNTALGYGALINNTDGYRNTAVGNDALRENIGVMDDVSHHHPGSRNTAVGDLALVINETGRSNTAVGVDAGQCVWSGDENTAVGGHALSGIWRSDGPDGEPRYDKKVCSYNTAVGESALHRSDADANTGVGAYSLFYNVDGVNNTALGYRANENMKGANGSTALGAKSEAEWSNSVAVGFGTKTTRSHQVHIGPRCLEMGATNGIGWPDAGSGDIRLNVYDTGDGTLGLRVLWPGGGQTILATET